MQLALDSLVIDLIFRQGAELDLEALIEALGGTELVEQRTVIDPDMQDPRFEMEVSPSMPFRRRGERRLLILDDSVAPMRADPQREAIIPLDLRGERERLIAACAAAPIRLGRIFALGSWGDAVLIARDATDLRAIALMSWLFDPTIDADGKQRGRQLTQAQFEAKLAVYDKRLEELNEQQILGSIGHARFERRGELLVVDVLGEDGTWNVNHSLTLEANLCAIDKFSMIPGAPAGGRKVEPERRPAPEPVAEPVASGPALSFTEIAKRVVLLFPAERFEPLIAAALGRKDFDSIIQNGDGIPGQIRDRIHEQGAGFIAPLEFLSEVFVNGTPLSRSDFDKSASIVVDAVRGLEVHCPRYGAVMLIDIPDKGRFISSEIESIVEVVSYLGN